MADLVRWARGLAEEHLSGSGRRWSHVQAVGSLAERISPAFGADADVLVAAAYLHDVGYAAGVAVTGFHPLDGGRLVRRLGEDQVACLVAHHSAARLEAVLRGFTDYEQEFPYGRSPLDDAVTFCDLTTGPSGRPMALRDRVADIARRHGPESTTTRAILGNVDELEVVCASTYDRVRSAGIDLG